MPTKTKHDSKTDDLRLIHYEQAFENIRHAEKLANTSFQFFVAVVGGILAFVFSGSFPILSTISNVVYSFPLGFIVIYSLILGLLLIEFRKRRDKELYIAIKNIMPLFNIQSFGEAPAETPVYVFHLQFALAVAIGGASVYLLFVNVITSLWEINWWSFTIPILPLLGYILFMNSRFQGSQSNTLSPQRDKDKKHA